MGYHVLLGSFVQALMALQGHGLQVEEKDLRRAEQLGDMQRREPAWRPGIFMGFFTGKTMGKSGGFTQTSGNELANLGIFF